MLKGVLGALVACATVGPIAASAQEEIVVQPLYGDAPRPLVNPGDWITYEDYPPQARREELSGTTRVRLDVDEQGAPIRCTVTETSGSEVLDTATCAELMERARFHPVLNELGVAAPSVYETSVRWSGSEDAPDPLATTPRPIDTRLWVDLPNLQFDPAIQGDRTAMFDLEVDGTGRVTDCTITQGSGDQKFDTSLCDQLEVNAAFDVSSSGPGRYSGGETMPEQALRSFPDIARSHPRTRNYGILAFIEEDGSVSDCRWIGRNAPALDPWPVCHRSSWVDQRNVDGRLVRGEVQLGVSQREIDELALRRGSSNHPANPEMTGANSPK